MWGWVVAKFASLRVSVNRLLRLLLSFPHQAHQGSAILVQASPASHQSRHAQDRQESRASAEPTDDLHRHRPDVPLHPGSGGRMGDVILSGRARVIGRLHNPHRVPPCDHFG